MAYNRWLAHPGVKGQKWGEKNGPPYPLDSSKSDGHRLLSDGSPQGKKKLRKTKTVFVSGSSKTQDPQSGYYRGELPKDIRLALREHIRNGNKIIVGDAPGIDRQVQDYLKKQNYDNVEIYGPGKEVRYSANPKWKTNPVDDPDHEPGSKEWLAKKDIAMAEAADEGLAVILDDGAKATRNNVRRLLESQKVAKVYSLNKDGTNMWADEKELMSDKVVPKTTTVSRSMAKANKIYDTLSDQEKYFLTAEENSPRYINPGDYNKKHSSNVYSRIEQYKDVPVSVIDIWQNEDKIGEVSIAVRNGAEYRHKGYASRALENGLKYFYNNPEMEYLVWGVNAKNRPSIELAKKYGFTFFEDVDGEWHTYVKDKEAKHTMAYNRWIYPDELYHHGVKGQKWGEKNGPPYPLDRSISDGSKLLPKADGSPQTQTKKKYKTSEKTAYQRKKRQEKIESTPDYKEKHSFVAEAKRKYREYAKNQAAYRRFRDEFEAKSEKDWKDATERLEKLGLSEEEANRLVDSTYSRGHGIPGQSWGPRVGDKTQGQKLNEAIDKYLAEKEATAKQEAAAQKAARDAAKEHGTAEEVMKYRDTFNKDEWNEIAGRLEAEARVRKLLDKPVQSFDSKSNQNDSSSVSAPEKKKLRKIYESGTAEEVYRNRDKFTVEQLEAVERRLSAEEKVGNYASRQFNLDSERMQKLKKIANVIKVVGDTADSVKKIQNVFNGGGGGDGKKKDKNNGGGGGDKKVDNSGEVKRTTVVVEETKKDGTTKKTSTWDTSAKGPTSWLNKREKNKK